MKTPIVPCFLSSNWWIFNGYVSFREGSQNTVHIFWLAVSHQVKISLLFASFFWKKSKVRLFQKFVSRSFFDLHRYCATQTNIKNTHAKFKWTAHHDVWLILTSHHISLNTIHLSFSGVPKDYHGLPPGISIGWRNLDLHRMTLLRLWPGRWSMQAPHHLSCSLPDMVNPMYSGVKPLPIIHLVVHGLSCLMLFVVFF